MAIVAKINLDKLSLDELRTLQKDVKKAIVSYEARKRKEAQGALEAKAKEMGFSLAELTGKQKTARTAGVPKYVHPENPSQTWTGRGRQPGWIKEALAEGKSIEDFRISK